MKILFFITLVSFFTMANENGEKFALPSSAIESEKIVTVLNVNPSYVWAKEKITNLVQNENFITAVGNIKESPRKKHLLWIELGFFITMFVFRIWRQSKSRNWFTRFGVGLLLTLFTWVGVLFLIPALVLGEPFHIVIGSIFQIIFS